MVYHRLSSVILMSLLQLPYIATATEYSLDEVWTRISRQSKAQQAAQLATQAMGVARDRAGAHWLPHIYVDAKGYQTNDPGLSFFGILSQRSVTSADFDPNSLNNPEKHFYSRGALGIDLPIYEGGMRLAQEEVYLHLYESKVNENAVIKSAQYAEVSRVYGSLIGLSDQREKLNELLGSVNRLMRTYQVGSKSNPVGYSGLLGLKTLNNRLIGLLSENQAKLNAGRKELESFGLAHEEWSPLKSAVIDFVDRYFSPSAKGESARTQSAKAVAQAAQSRALMEKARYLPRIGVFAEEYLFNGVRTTESGYSAGVYLQWSLVNPSDYGVAKEARLNAMAAEFHASAQIEQDNAEVAGLGEAIMTIRENLKLMEESESLLSEQTRVASDLFKNGSINIHQVVEIMSRRADLISNHTDAQLSLLKLSADRLAKTYSPSAQLVPEVSK